MYSYMGCCGDGAAHLPDPPRMRLLLLLCGLALLASVRSADVYCATPNVFISSPFPQTTLLLETSCLVLDWPTGTFTMNGTTKYSKQDNPAVSLPPVTVTGQVYLLPDGIGFSYPAENATYCSQSSYSAPPLCPLVQRSTTGPWKVFYRISGGTTTSIMIAYTAPDENSNGQPASFLGATSPFTYYCQGMCSDIADQVPQPDTLNVTVRRRLSSPNHRME